MTSKKLKILGTAKNTDRISDLPDVVLSHILSFMPTKYAIRTRVLSRRWKYLFSLVQSLSFCCPPTPIPYNFGRFMNFVDWVFSSYNVEQMDKFHYYSGCLSEFFRLLSWISDFVRHGVQELDISYTCMVTQTLPCGVFTCKRLTILKICAYFNVEIPDDVFLPHVRKIYLTTISFNDGFSTGRLFRSCHVLEDINLCKCKMGDIEVLELAVPTLKSFQMSLNFHDKFDLVLNAPNVEYFEYSRNEAHGFYALQGLKTLAKADISFYTYSDDLEKNVGAICHVWHLHLCVLMLQTFNRWEQPLPVFSNLIHLEIIDKSYSYSRLVLEILDKTPHLQVFVIDNDYSNMFQYNPLLPKDVPACVSLHLKELEFHSYEMSKHEFKLVEYFLKNAKVLEKLKVRCKYKSDEQVEMNKKLLALPRCSMVCQII